MTNVDVLDEGGSVEASAAGLPVEFAQASTRDARQRRKALGRALQRRAPEVAATVVAHWYNRRSRSKLPAAVAMKLITRPCSLGTELVGRYLANGGVATAAEMQELDGSAKPSVTHDIPLTDITKNYLVWRDTTLRVLREEGERLGVERDVLREATLVIRQSCDVSVVRMVKEFDVQRRDLEARLEVERAKLAHLALHDSLTGLPNRALLLDRLSHAVALSQRRQRDVAVLFLDLNGFKAINDTLGHQAGDRVLVAVADCLTRLVRSSDTVARLGGDEFVILCPDLIGGERALAALSERIETGVAAHYPVGHEFHVSVSVGVAIAGDTSDPQQVLVEADAAMYAAKLRHYARVEDADQP